MEKKIISKIEETLFINDYFMDDEGTLIEKTIVQCYIAKIDDNQIEISSPTIFLPKIYEKNKTAIDNEILQFKSNFEEKYGLAKQGELETQIQQLQEENQNILLGLAELYETIYPNTEA